jgi:hypothetical protein
VSLATGLAEEPALLLVDEPTAGLRDEERAQVVAVLARCAETSAVLLVTHNRADALALPGTTALLAGGEVVEQAPTGEFFAAPRSAITQTFVETGSCAVSGPLGLDALAALGVVPAARLLSADRTETAQSGIWAAFASPPLALRFVHGGLLAGVRRPGLFGSVDRDLRALADAGIKLLVCLEETQVVAPELIARYGLAAHALAVPDMDAPALEDARALCALIDQFVDADRPRGGSLPRGPGPHGHRPVRVAHLARAHPRGGAAPRARGRAALRPVRTAARVPR